MKENIQNIIFDLGGVLLNIDYHRTILSFKNIGIPDFDNVFTQFHQNPVARDFEKGLVSAGAFRKYIAQLSSIHLTDTAIDSAWNAMLLDFPIERYQLLLRLKKNYKLFLLSNTNIIHYYAFQEIVKNSLPVNSLDELFNCAYYSHQIHMRKPDAEIFKYVLSDNKIEASETLFIDDSLQHVIAAKELNLITYHLDKGLDVQIAVYDHLKLL